MSDSHVHQSSSKKVRKNINIPQKMGFVVGTALALQLVDVGMSFWEGHDSSNMTFATVALSAAIICMCMMHSSKKEKDAKYVPRRVQAQGSVDQTTEENESSEDAHKQTARPP